MTATTTSADYRIENHGTICLIIPVSPECGAYLDVRMPPDAQTWGNGFAVEPRYMENILDDLSCEGFLCEPN